MRNTTRQCVIGLCFLATFFAVARVFAQAPAENPPPIVSFLDEQIKVCKSQDRTLARTYEFCKELSREPVRPGAYGRKKWYSSITNWIPFFGKDERYSSDDIRTLYKDWGRKPPIGESTRSKLIREESENKLKQQQEQAEQKWQEWISQNPNAGVEERQRAEIRIRLKGLDSSLPPKFDWRDYGINVGEVGFQGFGKCNTCWAFTGVDAIQISRQLTAIRTEKAWDKSLRPGARQLISYMVPEANYCDFNWHGEAFTFLVDKGLPLGGSTKYVDSGIGWNRDSTNFVRALTWDYVHKPADQVAPNDEIKRAIISYGSVVSLVKFDYCLKLYGSGVFNERQNELGQHLVVIIGWDDAKSAWLIKNSYSTEWGEKGFGWIKYGSNNIGQFAAWVAADPAEEEKLAKELNQNRER